VTQTSPKDPLKSPRERRDKNSNERWKKEDQRVLQGQGDPRKYLKRNKRQIERKINKIPNQKKNKYK